MRQSTALYIFVVNLQTEWSVSITITECRSKTTVVRPSLHLAELQVLWIWSVHLRSPDIVTPKYLPISPIGMIVELICSYTWFHSLNGDN